MPHIPLVPEETATGERAEVYRSLRSRGPVANILTVEGENPKALRAHLDLYRTLMFGASPLSRVQREMIAVVVSATNGCHY